MEVILLKKVVFTLFLLVGLICTPYPCYAYEFTEKLPSINKTYKPPEQSREELYQDIFVSLLMPEIQKSVDNYYKEFFTDTPMVAPYDLTILKAERPNGYRTFVFMIELEVYPYFGAHNSVGVDRITIRLGGSGDVKVEKFEHIKSYELPPNYQNIVKKKY